jgi:type I restriction enzyme M protein
LWSHITELARNDYNLNISRYVSTATSEEVIDLKAVHTELVRIEQQAADAAARHNAFLAELGLAPI